MKAIEEKLKAAQFWANEARVNIDRYQEDLHVFSTIGNEIVPEQRRSKRLQDARIMIYHYRDELAKRLAESAAYEAALANADVEVVA